MKAQFWSLLLLSLTMIVQDGAEADILIRTKSSNNLRNISIDRIHFETFYNYLCATVYQTVIVNLIPAGKVRSHGYNVINVTRKALRLENSSSDFSCQYDSNSNTFICSRLSLDSESASNNWNKSECYFLGRADCECVEIKWRYNEETMMNTEKKTFLRQCEECRKTGKMSPSVPLRPSTVKPEPDTTRQENSTDDSTPVVAAVVSVVITATLTATLTATAVIICRKRRCFKTVEFPHLRNDNRLQSSSNSSNVHEENSTSATKKGSRKQKFQMYEEIDDIDDGLKVNNDSLKPTCRTDFITQDDLNSSGVQEYTKDERKGGVYLTMEPRKDSRVTLDNQKLLPVAETGSHTEIVKNRKLYKSRDQLKSEKNDSGSRVEYRPGMISVNDYGYSGIDNDYTEDANLISEQMAYREVSSNGDDADQYEYVGSDHGNPSNLPQQQNKDKQASIDENSTDITYTTVETVRGSYDGAREHPVNKYSRLREEVRDMKNLYNILPQDYENTQT